MQYQKESEKQRSKKDIYPEQKLAGDLDPAAYYKKVRQDLENCFWSNINEIAKKISIGKGFSDSRYSNKILKCHKSYFRSLKGGTNLTEEHIQKAIEYEISKQTELYQYLNELKNEFEKHGVKLEILPSGSHLSDCYWSTGHTPGCNIRTDSGALLSAFPLIPAQTNSYMALTQEPVAAKILHLNSHCIIFMNHDQDPGEKFAEVAANSFSNGTDVRSEFQGSWSALLYDNYLIVDSDKDHTKEEIDNYFKKYNILAFIETNSGSFNARIHISNMDATSSFLNGHVK